MSSTVKRYSVQICDQCIRLEGEACNNPECIFIRKTMGEVRHYLDVMCLRPIVDGGGIDLSESSICRCHPYPEADAEVNLDGHEYGPAIVKTEGKVTTHARTCQRCGHVWVVKEELEHSTIISIPYGPKCPCA